MVRENNCQFVSTRYEIDIYFRLFTHLNYICCTNFVYELINNDDDE